MLPLDAQPGVGEGEGLAQSSTFLNAARACTARVINEKGSPMGQKTRSHMRLVGRVSGEMKTLGLRMDWSDGRKNSSSGGPPSHTA